MTKFWTNASGTIWWPNLELIQVAPSGYQICNQFKKCYWNQSWTILAERFTQDMESIPWVRCASGNVWEHRYMQCICAIISTYHTFRCDSFVWLVLIPYLPQSVSRSIGRSIHTLWDNYRISGHASLFHKLTMTISFQEKEILFHFDLKNCWSWQDSNLQSPDS